MICRYCQKHTEKSLRKALLRQTELDAERKRNNSKQQTLKIPGDIQNTYIINSIDTVTSHQWMNPISYYLSLENRSDKIIKKDLGHMQANQKDYSLRHNYSKVYGTDRKQST